MPAHPEGTEKPAQPSPSGQVRGAENFVPPRRTQPRRLLALVVVTFLPLLALLLWLRSLGEIDLRAMNDLGLVSVLPPLTFVALVVLTVSFCFALRTFSSQTPLMLLHLGTLILMLYGATALVEEVPRFAVSWRHAGIADHIAQNGAVDPRIDAYFNWPGFFTLAALLTELSGFSNPISFTRWASVYSSLLFLAPLILIFRAATHDPRLTWLATWIFFLTNWVGQDYFSPQAFTYFLYLVILAILLTWFRRTEARSGQRATTPQGDEPAQGRRWLAILFNRARSLEIHEPGQPSLSTDRRVGLMAIVVVLFAIMVPSHQLTPFATILSVTALVAVRRCTARGLPVLMTVILVTWLGFMTVAYLKSHLPGVTEGLGDVSKNAGDSVGKRLRGTPEHLFVLRVRLMFTAGLWGLAFFGALRRLRHGHRDLAYGALALAPFSVMGMQSYGGESLLRVYLFALPFVAFFVAAFFLPSVRSALTWGKTAVVGFCVLAILAGFVVARYGNERANQYSSSEIEAIDHLYAIAPKGSVLLAGSENVPWQSRHYAEYRHLPLTVLEEHYQQPLPRLEDVVSLLPNRPGGKDLFVLITRAQKAHVELLGVWPPGTLEKLETELVTSPLFRVVFLNRDAIIFEGTTSGASARSGGVAGPVAMGDRRIGHGG